MNAQIDKRDFLAAGIECVSLIDRFAERLSDHIDDADILMGIGKTLDPGGDIGIAAAAVQVPPNIGEALFGDGNEIAHIDLLIGSKDGPVGSAFAHALATQSDGHSNLLAVLTLQQGNIRHGEAKQQKTDMSRMRANKEEIDAVGDDYAANEKDYYDPSGVGVKQEPVKVGPKIGRNDPCPCGSGKKYKHCHGKSEA